MNTTRLLGAALLSLLCSCIDDKDVGLGGADGGGGGDSGSMTTGSSSSGGTTRASSGGTTDDPSSGGVETSSSTSGSSGSSGGTASEERQLCESSGGVWDPLSCGDYVCGLPPDCRAIVPGCDCGVGSNYVEAVGCVADEACEAVEFDCFGELCVAPDSYCDVWGASINCDPTPAACEGSYTCACLGDAVGGSCEKQADGSIFVYVPGGP